MNDQSRFFEEILKVIFFYIIKQINKCAFAGILCYSSVFGFLELNLIGNNFRKLTAIVRDPALANVFSHIFSELHLMILQQNFGFETR